MQKLIQKFTLITPRLKSPDSSTAFNNITFEEDSLPCCHSSLFEIEDELRFF